MDWCSDQRRPFCSCYDAVQVSFFGFVVALFLGESIVTLCLKVEHILTCVALYLGGAGQHMSKLNKSHVARLTQVSP